MRTARTKLVDDAHTRVCGIDPQATGPQPGLDIADEPPRPRHALRTEAVA